MSFFFSHETKMAEQMLSHIAIRFIVIFVIDYSITSGQSVWNISPGSLSTRS